MISNHFDRGTQSTFLGVIPETTTPLPYKQQTVLTGSGPLEGFNEYTNT